MQNNLDRYHSAGLFRDTSKVQPNDLKMQELEGGLFERVMSMNILDSARIIAIEPTYFDIANFNVEPRAITKKAKQVHANALRVGFFSHQGYAYYPSKIAPRVPGLGNRDLLNEFREACEAEGLALVVYTNSRFDMKMARKHPSWVTRLDGKPFRLKGLPIYGMCLSSPYLDYYISIVSEIVSRYRPKVLYVDNYIISFYCRCRFCTDRCQRDLGFSPPAEPNWRSKRWPPYREWVKTRNIEGAERIAQAVKKIDREIKVVFNRGNFWYCHSYPPSQTREIANRIGEAVHMEAGVRFYARPFWHIDETCMFGQTTGRPFWAWVEYNIMPWSHISCPPAEIEIKAIKVFANNARPVLWSLPRFPDCDERGLAGVSRVYGLAEKYSDYFDGKRPYRFACLLFSHLTNDNYGRSREPGWEVPPTGRSLAYRHSFQGFFSLLQRSHIPFSVEVDQFLTKEALRQYPLLILPNTAAMDETLPKLVRQYVTEGGLLIATYETSLYDKNGDKLEDFSLNDLFGCHLETRLAQLQKEEYRAAYVELFSRRWSGLASGLRLPVAGNCLAVNPGESTESGGVLLSPTRYYCDFPGNPTGVPGVLLNKYGKGKVLYFPWEFGRAYRLNGFPDYEKIINAFIQAFCRKLPLKTDLPPTVQLSLSEVEDGYLLFLINMTADLGKPVEKVAEIRDARIDLYEKALGHIKRVKSLLTGKRKNLSRKKMWVELRLDILGAFEVLHILAERKPHSRKRSRIPPRPQS